MILTILYLQSDIESLYLAQGVVEQNIKPLSVTLNPTIIRKSELRKPLQSKTYPNSAGLSTTLTTEHQNLPVTESSWMPKSSKTSGYVIRLSVLTFINLFYKQQCHISRKSRMRDIPKDFSYTIHLLHIPEISYHISSEDTAFAVIFWKYYFFNF
jgi:hypothetical protein